MKKAADAFRSIGEVSQLVGVAPHVLRYWETQFPLFSPVKRRDGRRYYRPDDIRLAAGICQTLREDGVSIRDAKKQMNADRGAALKQIGAERLGGDFLADAAESAEAAPARKARPARAAKKAATKPASAAAPGTDAAVDGTKTTKAAKMQDSLPLFPELTPAGKSDTADKTAKAEKPAPKPAARRKAAKPRKAAATAAPVATGANGPWLGRLNRMRDQLRDRPQLPAAQVQALLARLSEARRAASS